MTVDRAGFERFVEASARPLLRAAYLLTGNAEQAQDLVQSALERTWRRWDHVDAGTAEAYARRVMVNLHTDWLRRRPWRERTWADVPERDIGTDATVGVEDRATLLAALQTLSRRERAVVVLRYYLDLSEADTARELGLRLGTVKSLASRGLASLRTHPDFARPVAPSATPAPKRSESWTRSPT